MKQFFVFLVLLLWLRDVQLFCLRITFPNPNRFKGLPILTVDLPTILPCCSSYFISESCSIENGFKCFKTRCFRDKAPVVPVLTNEELSCDFNLSLVHNTSHMIISQQPWSELAYSNRHVVHVMAYAQLLWDAARKYAPHMPFLTLVMIGEVTIQMKSLFSNVN